MKFVHFVSAFSKDNVAAWSDTYGGSSHVTCHDGEDRDGEIDRSVKSEMVGSSDGKAGGDKIAINCTAWPNDELCAINCNLPTSLSKSSPPPFAISYPHPSPRAPNAPMPRIWRLIPRPDDKSLLPTRCCRILRREGRYLRGRHIAAACRRDLQGHRAIGARDPVKSELIASTMRAIRRTFCVAQRQAEALLRDDLVAMVDKLGNRPKDVRDRALLLLGFATAMRRSELAALDVADVEFVVKGMLLTIRRSKTDQEAQDALLRSRSVEPGIARRLP